MLQDISHVYTVCTQPRSCGTYDEHALHCIEHWEIDRVERENLDGGERQGQRAGVEAKGCALAQIGAGKRQLDVWR
jgi:hypothetical protein